MIAARALAVARPAERKRMVFFGATDVVTVRLAVKPYALDRKSVV